MRVRISWGRAFALTTFGIAVVVVTFAVLAYRRRWISDDGLIVVRTVRNILAGNGPVFNGFERAEANTSTLWTWILALVTGVGRQAPNLTAVVTGGVFSVSGLALAIDATRRWWRLRGETGVLAPATAWVVIATVPFWDFATTGLETGLMFLWIALCWRLLVTLQPGFRGELRAIIVFGLGPLIRPDFALIAVVFAVAGWLLVRPSRRRTLALIGAGVALPLAYEIFRAGYYGTLVPLPALAKSASAAKWGRGFEYVIDYVVPYSFWLPLVAIIPLVALAIRTRAFERRDLIVILAPIASGLLLALYVVRVGGDFMHGRLLLAPTFLLLLPALVWPVRKLTAASLALLAGWGIVTGYTRGQQPNAWQPYVMDERNGYAHWTRSRHPIDPALFIAADGVASVMAADAIATGRRSLVSEGGVETPLAPHWQVPLVFAAGRLGTGGLIAPIDGIVVDSLGLANPLGARITPTNAGGFVGHEKSLPFSWIRAEYSDPAVDGSIADGTPPLEIQAARRALQCGELKELLASVREPMSPGRFWANLTGAIRRTRLVIPANPFDAELNFCGTRSIRMDVVASSSYEGDGWAKVNAVDGVRTSTGVTNGYSSQVGPTQWIEVHFGRKRFNKVTLYPRTQPAIGIGFPIDFAIQVWDGSAWVDRVTRSQYPRPSSPQTFSWDGADVTDRIRIYATNLPDDGDGPRLQLAEIEVE
jgi:arabinofuranosyltransferase